MINKYFSECQLLGYLSKSINRVYVYVTAPCNVNSEAIIDVLRNEISTSDGTVARLIWVERGMPGFGEDCIFGDLPTIFINGERLVYYGKEDVGKKLLSRLPDSTADENERLKARMLKNGEDIF